MASEIQKTKLKLKVNNNDDTRLWRYPSPMPEFDGLSNFISSSWTTKDFIAQYKDDEGDLITIANQEDLNDAVTLALMTNQKSLKIFVLTQIRQKRRQNRNPSPPPSQNPSPSPKQFSSDHAMVLDFLTNAQITILLPEVFGSVISKLVSANQSLTLAQISDLFSTELTDPKFESIVSHPLFSKYSQLALPYISHKVFSQQSLYPHFEITTIKQWINQLLAMLAQVLAQNEETIGCRFKDIVIDIEYPEKTDTGKVIHFGVECDICQMYPIIGPRYKCSICPDWDCCEQCEPMHDHPLIKFKKSSKSHRNSSFDGLTEVIRRLAVGVEEKEEKKEEVNENEEMMVMDCICGAKMDKVCAKEAYKNGIVVYCDGKGCGNQALNEMVYHCPKGNDVYHKNGFDLCLECAGKRKEESKEEEVEVELEKEMYVPVLEDMAEPEDMPPLELEIELEEEEQMIVVPEVVVPVVPVVEVEVEQEPEVEVEPEQEPVVDEFVFADQLVTVREIMNMKENDNEIKRLLVENNGDISRVIPLLLE